MNTIISKLLLIIQDDSQHDVRYTIALFILNNLREVMDMSINELASRCFTSTNSINRFCKQLNFKSFPSFKEFIKSSNMLRTSQINQRYQANQREDPYALLQFINPILKKEKLMQEINDFVDLIHNSKRLVITGAVFPIALTLNFQEDMILFGKKILIQQIKDNYIHTDCLEDDDLLIIISVTGKLLELRHKNYIELLNCTNKKILISQFIVDIENLYRIHIPGNEDSEKYNTFLLILFEIVKFEYFKKYILLEQ